MPQCCHIYSRINPKRLYSIQAKLESNCAAEPELKDMAQRVGIKLGTPKVAYRLLYMCIQILRNAYVVTSSNVIIYVWLNLKILIFYYMMNVVVLIDLSFFHFLGINEIPKDCVSCTEILFHVCHTVNCVLCL